LAGIEEKEGFLHKSAMIADSIYLIGEITVFIEVRELFISYLVAVE